MKNITDAFEQQYRPRILLAVYQQDHTRYDEGSTYVEAYSFNQACKPINRRPLSLADNVLLSECVDKMKDNKKNFTHYDRVIPSNVLHIPNSASGHLAWYTKPKKKRLLFAAETQIENGLYPVPAILWIANCRQLNVYALPNGKRPDEKTVIYHAPFFNVYENAKVCMGNVSLEGLHYLRMEAFMTHWQTLFFSSYFSHSNFNNAVHGGMDALWKGLKESPKRFPIEKLKKANTNLKKLLA